ncbi:hypothetical protein B0I27_101464 [Arcticibacter pallidicorallinus]|uniref:Uncharacterized protein n=1 Tax=Arcticibacter pallidicorallinus TaxID=1259464 RepID=A0A2T0UC71_9SPHI|nr:hypothetical protein [Arcticibacter pallidicorallinus]PRY55492.1 hypothetical protein B0I27_101464 [Arcticibacter pallidicorallinus]
MIKELIGKPAIRFKVEYKIYQKLQHIALKHLNVTDMNKLRDRFEGQKFYHSFLIRSYAEVALEKLLNQATIDWTLKVDSKNYKPQFTYNGRSVELITASLDSYPTVPRGNYDIGIVAFINVDSRDVQILGFAPQETLIANIDSSSISPMFEALYFGHLKNFDFLTLIRD